MSRAEKVLLSQLIVLIAWLEWLADIALLIREHVSAVIDAVLGLESYEDGLECGVAGGESVSC